jgi:hypothetical protein
MSVNFGKDSPLFGYVGAGARTIQKTVKVVDRTSSTYNYYNKDVEDVTDTYENWFYSTDDSYKNTEITRIDYTYEREASFSFVNTEAKAFMEAGLGLDMGPMVWKMGWTNYEGNSLSLSILASF